MRGLFGPSLCHRQDKRARDRTLIRRLFLQPLLQNGSWRRLEADPFVKTYRLRICFAHQQLNFRDTARREPCLTGTNDRPAQAMGALLQRDRHVIEPAAMAIMPNHEAGDDVPGRTNCDENVRVLPGAGKAEIRYRVVVTRDQSAIALERNDGRFVAQSGGANLDGAIPRTAGDRRLRQGLIWLQSQSVSSTTMVT